MNNRPPVESSLSGSQPSGIERNDQPETNQTREEQLDQVNHELGAAIQHRDAMAAMNRSTPSTATKEWREEASQEVRRLRRKKSHLLQQQREQSLPAGPLTKDQRQTIATCRIVAPERACGSDDARILAGYLYLQCLVPVIQGREPAISDYSSPDAVQDLGWSRSQFLSTSLDLLKDDCPSTNPVGAVEHLVRPNIGKTAAMLYGEHSTYNFLVLLHQLPESSVIRQSLQRALDSIGDKA